MTVFYAALAVALGTAAGLGRVWLALPLAVVTAVCCLGAFTARGAHPVVPVACALVALSSGAGASAALRSAGETSSLLPRLAGRDFVVEVCGVAQRKRPRSIQVRAERVELAESAWTTTEPVRMSGRQVRSVRPGEWLCAKGELVPPRDGFDEAPLLTAERIGERRVASPVRYVAAIVRERFSDAASNALPRVHAGLLLGMTDGDTALIDEETNEDFRTTGISHIVAVSGSNVAVFLAILLVGVRAIVPRGRWLRVAVALPALAFFVFLTGLESSVLRATVATGIALVIGADGRRSEALSTAALAFVVLVLASPRLLIDVGFQLSFAATLGIILWSEALTRRFAALLGRPTRARSTVAAGLGTTIAAQVAVAPLLALHFGRIPGLGTLANVVAIPLSGVVMLGGLATLTAASLIPFLDWAPAVMRLPLDAILSSAHVFARVPAASITVGFMAACAAAGLVVTLVTRSRRARAAAVAFVLLSGGAAVGQARAGARCDRPSIVALDVGQGSAVLLRSGEHAIVVDTGPERGPIVEQLHASGVRKLDAIVVTHSHVDHALGALAVIEKLDVARLVGPPELVWASGEDVIRAARSAGIPFAPMIDGDTLDAGDIHLEAFWPQDPEPPPFDDDLVDQRGLVLLARIGGAEVLLPGDIRAEQQRKLADRGMTASVLVAPHHGSKNIDPTFTDSIGQQLTLITVGSPNMYGLPAPEAVAAYAERGPVFRTDEDGRVTVCLTDQGAEVLTER